MNVKHPVNKAEEIIFGITNCVFMVLGMMSFNLYINNALNIHNIIFGFIPVFFTAFVLSLLVGKLINKYNLYKITPVIRVFLMASIMSFAAPLVELGIVMPLGGYLVSFARNFAFALFLQLCFVMHIALFVLAKYRYVYMKLNR